MGFAVVPTVDTGHSRRQTVLLPCPLAGRVIRNMVTTTPLSVLLGGSNKCNPLGTAGTDEIWHSAQKFLPKFQAGRICSARIIQR
jgi:hypothetical protein